MLREVYFQDITLSNKRDNSYFLIISINNTLSIIKHMDRFSKTI